jgi:hypothetical protein
MFFESSLLPWQAAPFYCDTLISGSQGIEITENDEGLGV